MMMMAEHQDPVRAWRALKALLQSWKTQDEEGGKIVAAVCSALVRSEELRVQAHRAAAAAAQREEDEEGAGGGAAAHGSGVVGAATAGSGGVLDLFPGAWENLRLKTLTAVADSHFRQLDSMLAVLQDAQRSIDVLLEGVMAAVIGSAAGPDDVAAQWRDANGHGGLGGGGLGGGNVSPGKAAAAEAEASAWAWASKGVRTLEQPVCAMDHLEWMQDVAGMYRAELLRKRRFVADLKRAVNGGPPDAGSLSLPSSSGDDDGARRRLGSWRGSGSGPEEGDEEGSAGSGMDDDDVSDDEEEDGDRGAARSSARLFNPAVASLWATDTSPTSQVDVATVDRYLDSVFIRL